MRSTGRSVVVNARVVRHRGERFRSAPMVEHISYLQRDGVTREDRDASLFKARANVTDGYAFAARIDGDRRHFRFNVSPETLRFGACRLVSIDPKTIRPKSDIGALDARE